MEKAFGAAPDPQNPRVSPEIAAAYNNEDRADDLLRVNQNLARSTAAGVFGGDAIVPSIEFGGGLYGGGGGMGPYGLGGYGTTLGYGDPYSSPGRHGVGMYGGMGAEGWVYQRQGQSIDHVRIAQCRLLYKTEGVVQTIVHLLADFATEGLRIEHKDETVANFYQAWAKKIDLPGRIHRFIIDLLTTGNVFVWRKEAKLKTSEKTTMKRGQAYVIDGEMYDEKHRTIGDLTREIPKGTKIPWGYISLNPLQIQLRGSRIAGDEDWVFLLTRDDVTGLKKKGKKGGAFEELKNYRYYDELGDTEVNIPDHLKGKLRSISKPTGAYVAEVELDDERLSVMQDRTKTDYEAWATPSVYPAHKEIMFKRLMRMGEASAVESLKHMITLIKLGDTKEGLAPTPQSIQRVAGALAAGAQSHYLIWDDLISGEVLQPDLGKILDPKKYESIDKDIFMALGVSESVMTGQGSYANSFLSIKLLLEKLETIRNQMMNWLMFELRLIAERMSFRNLPNVRFGLMNLRDENTEKKLVADLFDRGILSQKTILEMYDLDYDMERKRQLHEKDNIETDNNPEEEGKKDVFGMPEPPVKSPVMMPSGPFRKNETAQPPKGFGEPQPGGTGGRPTNSKTPQQKKRTTKPKGVAGLIAYDRTRNFVQEALPIVERCLTAEAVQLHGVQDVRSLNKRAKAALDHMVIGVMCQIAPDSDMTDNLVYNTVGIVRSNPDVTADNPVYRGYCEMADQFSTKAEAREAFCTVYAATYAGIGGDYGRAEEDTTGADPERPIEGEGSSDEGTSVPE